MTGLNFGIAGSNKVTLVRQTELTECGLACLAMIAIFHGQKTDLGVLRRRYAPSLRGATLKDLMQVADQLGLAARAVKLPMEQLKNLQVPAILHWNMNHFVVLEKVSNSRALIHDPASGSGWISLEQVSDHFTGVAMELRPAADFKTGNAVERIGLSSLWSSISGVKRALAQILLLSIFLQLYIIILPYYIQISVDRALPALDSNLLATLALGFLLFTLFNVVATLLRGFTLLATGASLSFSLALNVARKLFRLPVEWFEKRHVGDILSRFQSLGPIEKLLTQGVVSALLDGILSLTTLIAMYFYSTALATVTLLSFILYAVVRFALFRAQRRAAENSIIASAAEQSVFIESIRGIRPLRLFGKETMRLGAWQSRLIEATNARLAGSKLSVWLVAAHALIFGIENVLVIWIAINSVISGELSLGMTFAYLAYKNQFVSKASSLMDQWVDFRMLGLHLERLGDIALSADDASFESRHFETDKFTGELRLEGVNYRYSACDPLILDGLNLVVRPGDHIAITGRSGGGKSTLVRILLGLVEATEGVMRIDGKPVKEFGLSNYRRHISGVLQDDSLFAGSIADNIALFEDEVDMARVHSAAKSAAIYDEVMAMPMRFETLVGDMGSALSGGQKQRILLARALYRDPKILILDEGTSHLDAAIEQQVNSSISKLGITRIVIAHRTETIRSANKVYGLSLGKLELIESKP